MESLSVADLVADDCPWPARELKDCIHRRGLFPTRTPYTSADAVATGQRCSHGQGRPLSEADVSACVPVAMFSLFSEVCVFRQTDSETRQSSSCLQLTLEFSQLFFFFPLHVLCQLLA